MDYSKIIRVEPGKRSGKPCIRGLRITVSDVLDYFASGMTHEQILRDFPYLTEEDIQACLAFAADRDAEQASSLVKLLFDENLSPGLFPGWQICFPTLRMLTSAALAESVTPLSGRLRQRKALQLCRRTGTFTIKLFCGLANQK